MSGLLVVLIVAPLASFGEDPGNARRGTAERPTRSALIGLAGAALGVERADGEGQKGLATSFLTATRTLRPGAPLTDFHTYQSLPAARGPVATRAEALARRGDLETSITRRDYRADGLWQAAYAAREGGVFSLEALRAAFLQPRFALYVGRKSCPLAHPLAPLLLDGGDIEDAFTEQARRVNALLETQLVAPGDGALAIDERLDQPRRKDSRRHRRNDEPGDRIRWHFSVRFERLYAMREASCGEGGSS